MFIAPFIIAKTWKQPRYVLVGEWININYLSTSTKRQSLSDWIKKQDTTIYCLQETHFNKVKFLEK